MQEYLDTKLDINYNQNQNVISKYCNIIETTFKDFTTKIITDESFKKDQLQRLKFFLLTNSQPCLIGDYDAKSEKGKLEKIFLGYEHSGRQKYEGIHPFPKNTEGKINSKLYTDNNPLDDKKVSSYIHKILSGEKIDNTSVDGGLQENIRITTLEKFVNWKEREFSLYANVDNYKNNDIMINWKYNLVLFKDIKDITIHKGSNTPQEEKYFSNGEIHFVRAGHLNNKNLNYLDISKVDKINELACKELKINTVPQNTILFPISGQSVNTNNIVITPERCCIVNHLVGISITNEILLKFIFYFLSYYKTSNLSPSDSYPTIKIEAI